MQTTIQAGISGTLLWTRTYRFIGMDPADIEKEEPRTEFSPMGLVYGRRILPVSKKSRRRNLSHGQHENADFGISAQARPPFALYPEIRCGAGASTRAQAFYPRRTLWRNPGQSRRLVRLPTSKFNKLEARKIEQREGLQLLTAGLQYVNRIVNIVLSRFIRE